MRPLPQEFISRIEKQFPNEHSVFLESLDRAVINSIHLNPKKNATSFQEEEKVEWWPNGRYLKSRPVFTLDPLFHAGAYYSQESSSMFIGLLASSVLEGQTSIRGLDMCAAPGGKSILLSEIIGDRGFLVSNEISKQRNAILKENLIKWGAANTFVTCNEPLAFEETSEFFDIVLIDAPCSGEGMFRKDEVAREEWSLSNVEMCATRQRDILESAMQATAPGGYLIYSTCTFADQENTEQCKFITDSDEWRGVFFDSISFENVIGEKTEAYQCFRFLPHNVKGEGFFTAVFQKAGQSEGRATRRGPRNDYFRAPSRKELDAIHKLFPSESDHIISKNNELFRLPCEYETFSYLLGKLFITKPGLLLGELIREDIIPAHDIAMLPNECSVYPTIEVDEATALSYLRKEDIRIETPIIGWALLTFKGVNLGWIKVLKNRVNNYYPKEWKIRMS